jgi:quercetin dioxygenase-like cupin family protein
VGMELDVHPLLLAPGEGETAVDRPEKTLRILADLDDVIVTWFHYAPGEKGPEPHVHHHHTDAFYVLEGEIEVSLGPDLETVLATPGSFAGAPPDVAHTFRNASDSPAIFLNFHAPSSGFGDHIRGKSSDFDQHDLPAGGGRPFTDAVFASPDTAETLRGDVRTHSILCDLPQLSVIDMTFQPEFEGVDPHTHADHVDAFYVLEGQIDFRAGDESHIAGPGTFFAAPRNSVHGFRNADDQPIRLLNLHAPPAGFVDRLREHG